MSDPYDLHRFVAAQESTYEIATNELREGRKRSHWMWYIFPQLAGLGQSSTARRFAVTSLGEAKAYLGHPVLGPRLETCTQLALDIPGRSAEAVFGYPDVLKFRSSMTLFAQIAEGPIFRQALDKYYGGEPDARTLRLLGGR